MHHNTKATDHDLLLRPLAKGAHRDHTAMCVMEAVAFFAGEIVA